MDARIILQVGVLCCNAVVNGYLQPSVFSNKIYSLTPVVLVGGKGKLLGNQIRLIYDASSKQDLIVMKNKVVIKTINLEPMTYTLFDAKSMDLVITETGTYFDKLLFIYSEASNAVKIRSNVLMRGNAFKVDYNALPVEDSSTEYFAVTFCSYGCISKIAIIWLPEKDNQGYREQDINVDITLPTGDKSLEVSVGTKKYRAGDTIEIMLRTDCVFLIKSNHDLTGTRITSSHNIAVLSGSEAKITSTTPVGFMFEHLTPVNRWGKEFIMLALHENSDGDIIKCLSYFSNTVLNFSDAEVKTLKNSGDSYERKIAANSPLHLLSDKPIIVYQFLTGTKSSGDIFDPDMVIVTPVEQYTSGRIVHRTKIGNYGYRVIYGYKTTTVKVNNSPPSWIEKKYEYNYFAGIVAITKNMVVEMSTPGGGGYEVQRSVTQDNSMALEVFSKNIDLNYITPKRLKPEDSTTTSKQAHISAGTESVTRAISTAGTITSTTSIMGVTTIISSSKRSMVTTVPNVVETTEGTKNTVQESTDPDMTSTSEPSSNKMTSSRMSTFKLQESLLVSTQFETRDMSTLETSVTTASADNSSDYFKYCACPCTHHDNLTFDELSAIVEALKEELKMNKEMLSLTIRRRTSAKDDRVSSTSIGICGALVITSVPFLVILSDLAGLYTKIVNQKGSSK